MIYSTNDVHPRERLSYWREVAARGYVEHDTLPADRASFKGEVGVSSLPDIGLATFDAAAHRVHRSARDTAQDETGDLLFSMVTSGDVLVNQDGRECTMTRGFYLIDSSRPFDVVLRQASKHVVARIPRRLLNARIGNISDLTGRLIEANAGVTSLTMGFLEMLPAQAEQLNPVAGLAVAEQFLDLAALTLTTVRERQGAPLSSPRAIALLRLKAAAERLLVEPGIKPERIAAEAGVSVRYANALLADEGTSIERYVTERRLERCRAALEDASQTRRSIGEIAFSWGFSDLSHFSRRFKVRYGLTPSDYRHQAEQRLLAGQPGSPPTP